MPAPALMFGNRCERVLTSPVCPWLGRGPFSPPCTTPHHTHTQFAPTLCRHRCGHERCAGARPHRRRHQQRAVSASSAAAAWPIPEHWVETVHVVGVLTAPRPPQAVAMAPPCCLRPMPTPRALVIRLNAWPPRRLAGILRNLSSYYYKEPTLLFLVRVAQVGCPAHTPRTHTHRRNTGLYSVGTEASGRLARTHLAHARGLCLRAAVTRIVWPTAHYPPCCPCRGWCTWARAC